MVAAIGAFLVADVVCLLLLWSPSRAVAMYAAGRSCCSFDDTMTAEKNRQLLLDTAGQTKKRQRLLAAEGALQLWETPRGSYWIPASSAPMLHVVVAEQQIEIYGTGRRAVQRGDIVIDCGADVGTFTRRALEYGASLVVAVEPMPEKQPCLRRTFAEEIAAGRVIVYAKGVWDKEDTLTLRGDTVVYQQNDARSWTVPLTTIDALVAELKLPRVDYIKMDIEGAEKKALAGGRNTIAKFRPRLSIATEHEPDDAQAIPEAVRRIVPGYRSETVFCVRDGGGVRPEAVYLY